MKNVLEERNRELSILNRIAEALNREVELRQALHTALASILELFKLETGWIFLLDEETGKFFTAATIGLPPALEDHPRRLGGTCYCIDDYLEGEMEGAANINAILCSRLKDLKAGTEGIRYHASIALYAQEKPLGILNVGSTDWREISSDELRLLHTVGDLMSIAIERARLFHRSTEIGAVNERNRIAREIHDTIAQGLVAIALQLETADLLLDTGADTGQIQAAITRALALTRDNLEEARRSVMDLRAAPLDQRTLPEAIQALLDNLPVQSNLEVIGSSPPLGVRISTGLYRIAQEAINNARVHAQSKKINVVLTLIPERVHMVIEDDGIGFTVSDYHKDRFGLIGLEERARLLNGTLDIASTPKEGTIIEVTIPLDLA